MGLFIDRQLNSVLTLEDQQDLQFSANDCACVCQGCGIVLWVGSSNDYCKRGIFSDLLRHKQLWHFNRVKTKWNFPYNSNSQHSLFSLCRTFLSAQGLSCSSVSVQAFRERRLWCTPTIHLKDSCLTETTSVFCHGPTQQERKKTLISSALWTSSWLGPISTTLDMCKTLLTVAHIL